MAIMREAYAVPVMACTRAVGPGYVLVPGRTKVRVCRPWPTMEQDHVPRARSCIAGRRRVEGASDASGRPRTRTAHSGRAGHRRAGRQGVAAPVRPGCDGGGRGHPRGVRAHRRRTVRAVADRLRAPTPAYRTRRAVGAVAGPDEQAGPRRLGDHGSEGHGADTRRGRRGAGRPGEPGGAGGRHLAAPCCTTTPSSHATRACAGCWAPSPRTATRRQCGPCAPCSRTGAPSAPCPGSRP